MLTKVEDVSDIAFGFMGSKALFAGLHCSVFTHLASGALTPEQVAKASGLHPDRARTLLTALAGLDLIGVDDEGRFRNSPAAETFLVKGARHDFGDYLRLQIDRQMYRLLDQIDAALTDTLPSDATASYAEWFADPDEARLYSESQHAGSLSPARGLAKATDLSDAKTLLDVGGGTGAFAITLCQAFPNLSAVIVDFPNVATLGRDYVADAGLTDRIRYVEGNAITTDWPEGQDVVLMSYLFSGVPASEHNRLMTRARDVLNPGGRLFIHDFVVHADRTGPKNAALWQLQHTAFTPHARSLDDETLLAELVSHGFEETTIRMMIPDMTMLAEGRKPA